VNDFAERLQAMKKARGWTSYRLAQLAGVTPQAVAKLEKPGCDPKLSTLVKLAGAFGVEVWEMLETASKLKVKASRKKRPGKASSAPDPA
jgi:transcriptional regulator with XRE-family HTH domain